MNRNTIGSFWCIRVLARSYNCGSLGIASTNRKIRTHGNYKFNYIFADGHAQNLNIYETAQDITSDYQAKQMWTTDPND
ncbi:MAG: hypothetical protein MK132_24610 [Lentisphaerales bacterium]|nr:hypothetical protein [Lentisphaerales bacterium]